MPAPGPPQRLPRARAEDDREFESILQDIITNDPLLSDILMGGNKKKRYFKSNIKLSFNR